MKFIERRTELKMDKERKAYIDIEGGRKMR
jgi:hypothetical protein